MTGCPDCAKRSLWAYRTYRAHIFIINLPKGEHNGLPFNLNFKSILRWFLYKFVLGNMASYWYRSVLKEGKKVHDQQSTRTTQAKMPIMRDGTSISEQ
jgi:hypothetical protein